MKKVKGKKRFFLITCLMLLCAVAGIGGVLAYFTDSEQTNNKLKVAVNDTSIEEVFPDPSFKPGSVATGDTTPIGILMALAAGSFGVLEETVRRKKRQ